MSPIYSFACPLCGQTNDAEFGMNDDKHLKCLNCGSDMNRVWGPVYITGDLPGRWRGNYDSQLEANVSSESERRRLVRQRGLVESTDKPEHIKEAHYIMKQVAGAPRREAEQGANEVKQIGRRRQAKAREAIVKETLGKVKI